MSNKSSNNKLFNGDRSIKSNYTIANAWECLPIVDELNKGIVLDGYFAKDCSGFIIIIYDCVDHHLVRWLDRSYPPKVKFIGNFDSTKSIYQHAVRQYEMMDPLTQETQLISEVDSISPIARYSPFKTSLKKTDTILKYETTYFHDKQIIPGSIVSIRDDQILIMKSVPSNNEENHENVEDIIQEKFSGESISIFDMASSYLPVINSPIPNIPRIAFDIEVLSPKGTFPKPNVAEFPIHAIATHDSNGKSVQFIYGIAPSPREIKTINDTLGFAPEMRTFTVEKLMLQAFFSFVRQFPILLSYNGDNFDLYYLHSRAKKLGIASPIVEGHPRGFKPRRPKRWQVKSDGEFNQLQEKYQQQIQYALDRRELQIKGMIHIDLYRLFSNNSVRLYAFGGKYFRVGLDDVGEALLVIKKIKHHKWFDQMEIDETTIYNIRDAEITYRLTSFSNNLTMHLIIMLMRIGKMTISYVNREPISKWILNWIAYEHKRINAILPNKKAITDAKGSFVSTSIIGNKQYQGAIVLDPKPGIWWDVKVMDFASLYPSVIKHYRLSYETLRCEHQQCQRNIVPGLEHWVCNQQGIMSQAVGFVRDVRVKYYKQIKLKTASEKTFNTTIQAALKVFINASYGVFGTPTFPLFCPPMAESVTAFSRHALLEAKKLVEEMDLNIVYGDTDSIFIHQPTQKQLNRLQIWSVVSLGIELGIDYSFRYLVLSSHKKNYFGVTDENKIIVKGLQLKKRNTALFIKHCWKLIQQELIEVKDQQDLELSKEKIADILRQSHQQLMDYRIDKEELSQNLTINKPVKDYVNNNQSAQIIMQLLDDQKNNAQDVKEGSMFSIVKVKPFKVLIKTAELRFVDKGKLMDCTIKCLDDVKDMQEIDLRVYETLFKNAFTPLIDAFDLSWAQIINPIRPLSSFF